LREAAEAVEDLGAIEEASSESGVIVESKARRHPAFHTFPHLVKVGIAIAAIGGRFEVPPVQA
jgi:hypothetical protein